MIAGIVEPDLRILHAIQHIGPSKAFVLRSIAVCLETSINERSLVLIDELRLGRPVRDVPPACSGKDDGQQPFDDEDPSTLLLACSGGLADLACCVTSSRSAHQLPS